jgi:hypothetical protein
MAKSKFFDLAGDHPVERVDEMEDEDDDDDPINGFDRHRMLGFYSCIRGCRPR